MCGDNFKVTISGPSRGKGASRVHGLVSEFSNGTYIVEYSVTIAGLYYLSVNLGDRHISGSPFQLDAQPAATRASHSVAFGPQLTLSTAGNVSEFYILAKDTYGNEQHVSAGGNFSVLLRSADAVAGEDVQAKVEDGKSGLYTARYNAHMSGAYSTEVSFNGYPVFGSPYITLIHPGKASAAHSKARAKE